MEGDRLAPCGEHGGSGPSQFATPDMARGSSVDSSGVVTQIHTDLGPWQSFRSRSQYNGNMVLRLYRDYRTWL